MAQVPRPPLGRHPRAARRAGRARLVLARGDGAGRRGHADHARPTATSIATFYDMFDTEPLGPPPRLRVHEHLLLAARRRRAARARCAAAAEGVDDVQVRGFECLGACDIAPMASVDGDYVGPLTDADVDEVMSALADGRAVLPEKPARRASVDPGRAAGTDTVLPPGGDPEDRLGPSAPVEHRPTTSPARTTTMSHDADPLQGHRRARPRHARRLRAPRRLRGAEDARCR